VDDLFVYQVIRGTADLGPVEDAEGRTTSERPRIIQADNESEYICKFLDASGPNVMGSELIAAAIAQRLDLPVPRFAVLRFGNRKAFASLRVSRNPVSLRDGLLEQTENAAVVPDLIAFDILIENRDRHRPGNTIFARIGTLPERPYRLYTIDHSLSGLRFYGRADQPAIGPDTIQFTSHELLRTRITSAEDFTAVCDRIAALRPRDLSQIVGQAREHVDSACFDGLDQILIWRTQRIRQLVAHALEEWRSGTSG
jgi:hypothetical protein